MLYVFTSEVCVFSIILTLQINALILGSSRHLKYFLKTLKGLVYSFEAAFVNFSALKY